MPGLYTHYYIADKLIAKLPYAPRAVIDLYPDAYRLGALGMDLFSAMPKLSAELDYKFVFELFEKLCAEIFGNGSKCQLAYVIGLTCHYAADYMINPYLYYLFENGVPFYFGADKDYLALEKIRESADAHILNKMPAGLIKKMRAEPLSEVVNELAQLFEEAVSELVGYRIKAAKAERALSNTSIVFPRPYKLEKYDYLNRQKSTWEKVRNGGEATDLNYEELIEKVLDQALVLVDGIMRRARSEEMLEESNYAVNYLGILSRDKVL